MTEKQMWGWIKKAKWLDDPDSERVKAFFLAKLSAHACLELYAFIEAKYDSLSERFDKYAHAGKFDVSDDSWTDLKAEVVGRGKEFYEAITVAKLARMGSNSDYTENFRYVTHPLVEAEGALWTRLYGEWYNKKNRITIQNLLKKPKELPLYLRLDPFLDQLIGEVLDGTYGQ